MRPSRLPGSCRAIALGAALLLSACKGNSSSSGGCLSDSGHPLPLASESLRVDRGKPTFSNPTVGTNPLFPVNQVTSYVQLGVVEEQTFRAEINLSPATRVITWDGNPITVVESQYMAFMGGRLEETANDWYAQADDGAVWYLGEDVYDYVDGVVSSRDGTWRAGRDGPGAMIMPGNPQVGNVYRTENICGVVFEEVTVKATGVTVNGPTGRVNGAIKAIELHQDGLFEDKIFAPGYGEFTNGAPPGDNESMAIAVPIDALPGAPPANLVAIVEQTDRIFDGAQAGNWTNSGAALSAATTAWNAYRSGGVPPLLETQMTAAMSALTAAVNAHHAAAARQAAIDVAYAAHDFRLRHLPPAEINRDRFELWARRVLADAAASDTGGVTSDATTMEWVRDRFIHTLHSTDAGQLNTLLGDLRTAADAHDFAAATQAATRLRTLIAALP